MNGEPSNRLRPEHEHVLRLMRSLESEVSKLDSLLTPTAPTSVSIENVPAYPELPEFTKPMLQGVTDDSTTAESMSVDITYDKAQKTYSISGSRIALSNNCHIVIDRSTADSDRPYMAYPVDIAGMPLINKQNLHCTPLFMSEVGHWYALQQFGLFLPEPKDGQVTWQDIVQVCAAAQAYRHEYEKCIPIDDDEVVIVKSSVVGSTKPDCPAVDDSNNPFDYEDVRNRELSVSLAKKGRQSAIQLLLVNSVGFYEPRYEYFTRVPIAQSLGSYSLEDNLVTGDGEISVLTPDDFEHVQPANDDLIVKFRDVVRQAIVKTLS